MSADPLVRAFKTQGEVCGQFDSDFYGELAHLVAADLTPARALLPRGSTPRSRS